jgi:predicted permease
MDWLRSFFSRIAACFSKRRLDASLDEEIRAHLDMAIEEHIRGGVPEQEARRIALCEFGGITQAREAYRIQRGLPFVEHICRDVRFGFFQVCKSPGFTLTAILTLALGVGANATIFSMINGLLLRPLPVPQSGSLVVLGENRGGPKPVFSFPEPLFRGLERRHGAFSTVFAFDRWQFQVKSGPSTELVFGQYVSGSFFSALETAPLLGRVLTPRDDAKGGNSSGFATLISESFWNNHFHRDPSILGRRIVLDNVAFTIVGVMPRSFFGADPLERPQIFVPLADEEVLDGQRSMIKAAEHAWWLSVMGRLTPGATLDQANSQVSAASDAILRETVPDARWVAQTEKQHFRFFAEPGSTGFTYIRLQFSKPLVAVFAMCAGILLLACLNLASLLMARGAARQREFATRMSLGATRRRLIQQLLVEGLLLGIAGTVAGLAVAPVVSRLLAVVLLSGQQGAYLDTSLDARVFAFAAAAAILATLLFALLPAVKATSRNLIERMKDGQHATLIHERRAILPRILLGAEIGLALILVVCAGLVATSLLRLYTSGLGFDPHGIQNVRFSMNQAGLKGDAVLSLYRELGERIRHLPGVSSASYAMVVPFFGYDWDDDFADTAGNSHHVYMNFVAPAYFSTMRIPLLAGRPFAWNDTPSAGLKIILNQAAARQLFPDGNALGRTIHHDERKGPKNYDVVGIVGNAKYNDLRSPAPPTAYFAMSQADLTQSPSYTAIVRTTLPAGALANSIRVLTAQLAPQVPAPQVDSMETIIDNSLGAERMMTMLAVFFAICALAVTAIGLYGTLAYATARRTTEIGIRMALGARRSQVAAMVFLQNLFVVMGGVGIGLAAALLATRTLSSFLFQTSVHDPWVIAVSILALAFTACAASSLPALRAARIEPMTAIRRE